MRKPKVREGDATDAGVVQEMRWRHRLDRVCKQSRWMDRRPQKSLHSQKRKAMLMNESQLVNYEIINLSDLLRMRLVKSRKDD